ncbi:hypothetical protein ACQ4WX_51150 [Streptomyces lasalocidi]
MGERVVQVLQLTARQLKRLDGVGETGRIGVLRDGPDACLPL